MRYSQPLKLVNESSYDVMCKLEDLIDKSPLTHIVQTINRGDSNESTRLIQQSISPQVAGPKFIIFTAWKIDVTGTVYERSHGRMESLNE